VLVAVELDDGVEALFEGVAIGREADDGEEQRRVGLRGVRAADLEDFRRVSCVDAVARGGAGVAGEDGEGLAGDGEGRAAVVCVAGEWLEGCWGGGGQGGTYGLKPCWRWSAEAEEGAGAWLKE
jgi:hypothetical protein